MLALPPPPTTHKLIVLIGNKIHGRMTVISSDGNTLDFFHQVSQHPTLQLLQHAWMTVKEVDSIIHAFQQEFSHLKILKEFNLPWYSVTEQVVLMWLQGRNNTKYQQNQPMSSSPPPLFGEETLSCR